MKKILVPVDFSDSARNATAYAASLATSFDAEIKLLNAHLEPIPVGDGYMEAPLLLPPLQSEIENRIYKEVTDLEAKYEIEVSGDAVIGFAGDTIADVASEMSADLIVMGREAKKQNFIFGNTIIKTIRKTQIPVLIVPERVRYQPLKRIILAVDFNEMMYSDKFTILQELVNKFESSLTVLHIEKDSERMNASAISSKLQLNIALAKMTYYYENAEDKSIQQGILNFIDHHPADLLVMIAHRHSFLERIFETSYTAALNFNVNLPLLILKN